VVLTSVSLGKPGLWLTVRACLRADSDSSYIDGAPAFAGAPFASRVVVSV